MRYAPLIFGVAALGLMASPANARCSLETLNGQYLNHGTGRIFPPAFGVTQESVSTVAGYSIYNGDGSGADFVTFTINGTVIPVPATQLTKYTINRDVSGSDGVCTGTKTVIGGPTFNIYVAPDGLSFTEVATGAPVTPGSSVVGPGFAVEAMSYRVINFSENQQ